MANMTYVRTQHPISMPHTGGHAHVEANYGIAGGHFSLSGSVWAVDQYEKSTTIFNDEPDAAGQVTTEILTAFPWLQLFSVMHLSDAVSGAPIYAKSNGWYHFTNKGVVREWDGLGPASRAATYLRSVPLLFANVETQEEFDQVVDSLIPLWQAQADMTRKTYQLF